jgi:hypothetical protein
MSTIALAPLHAHPGQDTSEYLRELSSYSKQNGKYAATTADTKSGVISRQVLDIVAQMDDNVCLVEYLNFKEELLNILTFCYRGGSQTLAENIIGNGLATGATYVIVLRNRRSGVALPKSNDRRLIRYIIKEERLIFSAKEAGILKNKESIP